jgi:hypothetical protein
MVLVFVEVKLYRLNETKRKILLDSVLGKGTKVRFTIPIGSRKITIMNEGGKEENK